MDSSVPSAPERFMKLLEECVSRQNIECSRTPPSLATLERLCEERMELIANIAKEKDECIRSVSEEFENLKRTSSENRQKRVLNNARIETLEQTRRQQQKALDRTNMELNDLCSRGDSMLKEANRMDEKLTSLVRELDTLKLGVEKTKLDELSGRLDEIRQRQAKMGEERKPLKLREFPVILREKIMQIVPHETLEAFKSTSKKMSKFVEATRFTEKEPMILEIAINRNKIRTIDSRARCLDLVAGTEEHTPGPEKTTYLVREDENALEIRSADGIPLSEICDKRKVKLVLILDIEERWSSRVNKKIIETFKDFQIDHLSIVSGNDFEPEEMWIAFGKPRLELVAGDDDYNSKCMKCIQRLPCVTDLSVNIHLEDDSDTEEDFNDRIEEWKDGTREIKKWIVQSSYFCKREDKVFRRECDGKVMSIKFTDYDKKTFTVSD